MITVVVTTLLGVALAIAPVTQNPCARPCAFLGTNTAPTADQKTTCCACVTDAANAAAVPAEFQTRVGAICAKTEPPADACRACVSGGATLADCQAKGACPKTEPPADACRACVSGGATLADCQAKGVCAKVDPPTTDRCAADCAFLATGARPTADQAKKCCLCRAGTDAARQAACDGGLVNNACGDCLQKAREANDATAAKACYGANAPCPVPEPKDTCQTACATAADGDLCKRCQTLTAAPTTGTTEPATRPCATECNADTATSAEGRKACCVCAYKTRAGDSATREGAEAACAPVDTRPPETCASKCASATTDGATARACFDRCTAATGGVDQPTVRPTCADVCAANAKRAEAATTDAAKAFSLDACTAACAKREQADSLGDRVVAHCTKNADATTAAPTADDCRAAVTDEIKKRCDAITTGDKPAICNEQTTVADRLRSLAETDPAKARELAGRVRDGLDAPKPAADVVARLQDAAKRCAAAEPGSDAAKRCADFVAKAREHLKAAQERARARAVEVAKRVCAGRLNADDKKRLPADVKPTADTTNADETKTRKRDDATATGAAEPAVDAPKVEGDKAQCVARIRQVFATVRRAQFCAVRKRLEAVGAELAAVEDKEIDCSGQQRKRQTSTSVQVVCAGDKCASTLLTDADVESIDGESTAESSTVVINLTPGAVTDNDSSSASLIVSVFAVIVAVLAL